MLGNNSRCLGQFVLYTGGFIASKMSTQKTQVYHAHMDRDMLLFGDHFPGRPHEVFLDKIIDVATNKPNGNNITINRIKAKLSLTKLSFKMEKIVHFVWFSALRKLDLSEPHKRGAVIETFLI